MNAEFTRKNNRAKARTPEYGSNGARSEWETIYGIMKKAASHAGIREINESGGHFS